MKLLLGIFCTIFCFWGGYSGIGSVSRANELKKIASQAYQNQDYSQALAALAILADSFALKDPAIWANAALVRFQTQDSTATDFYQKVLQSNLADSALKSIAAQQLGIIWANKQQLEQALESTKNALLLDFENQQARFNYELIKKLKQQKDQQDQQDEKGQQDEKDPQNKKDPNDPDDQQSNDPQNKNKQTNDSQEAQQKAQMLLQAMRDNQMNHLQNRKLDPIRGRNPNGKTW